MADLQPGLQGEARVRVDGTNTAAAVGAGGVEVFGTPFMIALMEGACFRAVQPQLEPEGLSSVGTLVQVKHLAATPIGMEAVARATLVEVDGRRLVFDVEAWDQAEKIGEGRHERFVIQLQKFLDRVARKGARP